MAAKKKHRRRTGASHLMEKRGALYARRRVPLDLVDKLGSSDLTTPLGTDSKREASARSAAWNEKLDVGFSAIRNGLAPNEGRREWLRGFAAKALESLQAQVDEALAESLSQDDADEAANAYSDVYELLAPAVHDGEEWALRQALHLIEEDPDSLPREMWKRMAVVALRAIKATRFTIADLSPAMPPKARAKPAEESSVHAALAAINARFDDIGKAKRAKPLGEALKAYTTLKVQRGDWKNPEHIAAVKLGKFVAAIGADRSLDDVTAEEIADYLGSLKTPQGEPVEVGTKSLHHAGINAFYLEAIKQEWATRNPASGLRPKKSMSAHESRDAFTDAELITTFGAALLDEVNGARQRTKVREIHAERLWVPLISLTMTLRVNEASQLHLGDIVSSDGIECIQVAPDDATGRKVKNRTSIRTVPVPQVLVDLGFVDYVNARRAETGNDPKAQLFPTLVNIEGNGFASRVVQWFNGERGYLNRIGVKRKGLTFHSLRHSAIDRLHRAGVDPILRSAIEGHARTGGIGETTYIKGNSVAEMKAAIDSVDWEPVLSGLRVSLNR